MPFRVAVASRDATTAPSTTNNNANGTISEEYVERPDSPIDKTRGDSPPLQRPPPSMPTRTESRARIPPAVKVPTFEESNDPLWLLYNSQRRRVSIGSLVQNALWKKRREEENERRKIEERQLRLRGIITNKRVGETQEETQVLPRLPNGKAAAGKSPRPKTQGSTRSEVKPPTRPTTTTTTKTTTTTIAAKKNVISRPTTTATSMSTTTSVNTAAQRMKKTVTLSLPAQPPPPPEEDSYSTRPMSPHKSYNLSDHIRAAAMRPPTAESKDNFEQRMRGLFLPSLFQSSENLAQQIPHRKTLTENDDDSTSTTLNIQRRRQQRDEDDDPIIPRRRTQRDEDAHRNSSRSARFRAFIAPTKTQKKMKYPLATIDRATHELTPPDIDPPVLRWRFATHVVLMRNRVRIKVLEDEIKSEDDDGSGEAGGSEGEEWVRRLRCDVVSAIRVLRVLDAAQKEERDLDLLDSVLGKFKLFAKMAPFHRYKLFASCYPESHPRGATLIREGHTAKTMYLILTGECLLHIRPHNPTNSVTMRLGPGCVVGEFASLAMGAGEVRVQRATCLVRTLVIRIEKGDYISVVRESRGIEPTVVDFFATVPTFLSAEKSLHVMLAQRSVIRTFDSETLLLRASETTSNNYFIIKGHVRALHLVTFIKTDLGLIPGTSRHRYSLIPSASRKTTILGPRDELVRELAGVVELGPGQFFPPLVKSRVVEERMNPILTRRRGSSVFDLRNGTAGATRASTVSGNGGGGEGTTAFYDPELTPPSPFHFVVSEKLDCAVISRQDLMEILTPELYRRLNDNSLGITNVSGEEVEERYLKSQGWRSGSLELDGKVLKELNVVDSFKDRSWSSPVSQAVINDAKSLAAAYGTD